MQIVGAANRKPIAITALSFAMCEDLERVLCTPIKPMGIRELKGLGKLMTDRLNVYSAGLLEVSEIDISDHYKADFILVVGKVQHFHRMVRDYLEQSKVWDLVLKDSPRLVFRPHAALLRSCIL